MLVVCVCDASCASVDAHMLRRELKHAVAMVVLHGRSLHCVKWQQHIHSGLQHTIVGVVPGEAVELSEFNIGDERQNRK